MDEDSDAEIRALAARSRARAAAAATQPDTAQIPSEAARASLEVTSVPVSPNKPKPVQSPDPNRDIDDPIVSILLHSRLPDTLPLIVNRRVSQPLKAVRVGYCKFNNLPRELEESVFLTWRRRRLFDITNCRSIGISVDANGQVYIKGEHAAGSINSKVGDAVDDTGARLEMEVMTQEMYDADRAARQAKVTGAAALADNTTSQHGTNGATHTAPDERRIKVILQSKDYGEYRLSVRPTTRFQQIVDVFRKQRRVPSGSELFLMFDGEQLDGSATVDSSEIDDRDYVDVHIK